MDESLIGYATAMMASVIGVCGDKNLRASVKLHVESISRRFPDAAPILEYCRRIERLL
jgi:hypothetical protein